MHNSQGRATAPALLCKDLGLIRPELARRREGICKVNFVGRVFDQSETIRRLRKENVRLRKLIEKMAIRFNAQDLDRAIMSNFAPPPGLWDSVMCPGCMEVVCDSGCIYENARRNNCVNVKTIHFLETVSKMWEAQTYLGIRWCESHDLQNLYAAREND